MTVGIDELMNRAALTRFMVGAENLQGTWVEVALQQYVVRHCPLDADYIEMLLDRMGITGYSTEQIDVVIKDAEVGLMGLDELCVIYGVLPDDPIPEHPLKQLARAAGRSDD